MRLVLRALVVAGLLVVAGCGEDDGGVAETEETTTSTTEDPSSETTIEAADPADDAPQGRTACNAVASEEAADPGALREIADGAPDDVAEAIEALLATPGVEAEEALAEVCERYGVELD